MTTTLERDLRDALHRRAAGFRPRPREVPTATPAADVGRRILLPVAAIVLPIALLVAAVLALRGGAGDVDQVPAGETGDVPYLTVDVPGGAAGLSEEGRGPAPSVDDRNVEQSFRRPGRFDGPMAFVTTVTDSSSFGLVRPGEGVAPVTVRGLDGNLARYNGPDGGAMLSVVLDDGRALFVIAIGLDDAELVAFVDGLQERTDGLWDPPAGDLVEVPGAVAEDGTYWSVEAATADASYEVRLQGGTFGSWLSDRVASTVGPVEQVDVDGVPAALGAYSDRDWWLLLEPSPGRIVELRIAGDRAAVDEVLAAARFADEATWREWVAG